MLDLAISIDTDSKGNDIIETNHGEKLKAPDWPQDCEFQMIAYHPLDKTCEVISADVLSDDIGHAIRALQAARAFKDDQPEWYRRLARCAAGATSLRSEQQ